MSSPFCSAEQLFLDLKRSSLYNAIERGCVTLTIHERIKQVRKKYSLTMDDFGKRIGIGKSSVSTIESGKNNPSDQTVHFICREFNVNENWLRTGEGEMLVPFDRTSEISYFMGSLLREEGDTFKKRFVSALAKLEERDWVALEKLVTETNKSPEE